MKTTCIFDFLASRRPDPTNDPGWRLRVTGRPLVIAMAFVGVSLCAFAQNETPATTNQSPQAAITVAVAAEAQTQAQTPVPAGQAAAVVTNTVASAVEGGGTNGLTLNFRNAPIDLVLEHLSKAAGFIIVIDTPVKGSVSVIGQGLTRDEAVNLLNSELNKNGFAAIRSGPRTLKIMDKATAKSSNNPVKISNDPGSIPDNDEMVTQIIPIRYVEASQLVSDLSPFVSPGATIIANQAGNSIVVTDTQTNIRHLAEIIKAIDSSAEDVTEVRVFHLDYADPTDMATLLSGLFPDQNSASTPIRFGNRGGAGGGGGRFGGRGGGGGFGGGPGGFFAAALAANSGNGNPQQDRIKKRNQVVAVADARTSSVVVTATRDLMGQIEEMVTQLDKPGKKQRMTVIPVINGNATEIMQALQDTVGANTSRNTRNTQNDPFATRIQQNQNNNNTAFGGGTGNTARTRTGGF